MKKGISSFQKQRFLNCDSVTQDCKKSLADVLLNADTSGRKSTTKNLANMLTAMNSTNSKLDASISVAMSGTSEGIKYKSAYLNMVNVNKKGNVLAGREKPIVENNKQARVLDLKNKKIFNNNKENKVPNVAQKPNPKEKLSDKQVSTKLQAQKKVIETKTKPLGVNSRKQESALPPDSSLFECDETLNPFTNSDYSNTNTTIYVNPLTLYCEEYLDRPSAVPHNDISCTDQEQLKMISKKLTFEPKSELVKEPMKSLSVEEELEIWKQTKKSNDVSEDVYEKMLTNESCYHSDPYYFDTKQNNLNWLMRAILIDWMIEVAEEFSMKRVTLYSAVNYIDRYLSVTTNIQKGQLQLIGATALFIAFKMEVN